MNPLPQPRKFRYARPMTPFIRAFSVHILTASGAGLALMAMLAAGRSDWPVMFLWLLAAFLVDGIDGPLARRANVKTHAADWDGDILDLIVDYLTYVMIPAYAMVEAELIEPGWSLAGGIAICVSGAIYFADRRMKLADNSFSGFPACWNMVILVLFAIDFGSWGAMLMIIAIALAQFFPLKFIHPVRTDRWYRLTLTVTVIWAILGGWNAWVGFEGPVVAQVALILASLYLLLAGIAQQLTARVHTA